MNNLSWLIYLADVLPRISSATGFVAFMGGVFVIFGTVFYGVSLAIDDEIAVKASGRLKGLLVVAWVAVGLCAIVSAATPNKDTFYLIAASEAGERIAASPDTVEMLGDVKAIIKKNLKAMLDQ